MCDAFLYAKPISRMSVHDTVCGLPASEADTIVERGMPCFACLSMDRRTRRTISVDFLRRTSAFKRYERLRRFNGLITWTMPCAWLARMRSFALRALRGRGNKSQGGVTG